MNLEIETLKSTIRQKDEDISNLMAKSVVADSNWQRRVEDLKTHYEKFRQ